MTAMWLMDRDLPVGVECSMCGFCVLNTTESKFRHKIWCTNPTDKYFIRKH